MRRVLKIYLKFIISHRKKVNWILLDKFNFSKISRSRSLTWKCLESVQVTLMPCQGYVEYYRNGRITLKMYALLGKIRSSCEFYAFSEPYRIIDNSANEIFPSEFHRINEIFTEPILLNCLKKFIFIFSGSNIQIKCLFKF